MATRLDELMRVRRIKLARLREMGIDPFPAHAQKDVSNGEIVQNFGQFENKEVHVTGRLISWREHGKLVFGTLMDQSGEIQLFVREDLMEAGDIKEQTLSFGHLDLLDIGDFVQAFGEVIKTRTGEVSIQVRRLKILTKSLRPLPEKWSGIQDPEIAFRKRYLDLLMNPEKRHRFIRKSLFWEANRRFLRERGFVEVETPVLELVTGGADARPFITHMHSLDQDYFLRISTELYQKRLIGAGFEKVFTLAPNFRNEGMDDEHLPEYYQCEWYWAYADYRDNMALVRDLFHCVASEVYGKTRFTSRGMEFDLSDPWQEIDYVQIIKERFNIDIFSSADEEMFTVIKKHGVKLGGAINRQRLIDNLWKLIRKTIVGPAFLINEPKFMSPLAKAKPNDPRLTERFHVIIAGSEFGNGYSELNDPIDQQERFEEQQRIREAGDEEAQMMDTDFVEMLEYGMPPTSGWGHSERVFWFLEDVSGREGVLFPPIRKIKNE